MDPKLAEIYGTNQQNDSDLEKLAAAELAEGLANDDQLDTDGLSEEELEAVAQDVLNGGEEGQEDGGDEAQEKLAEADYLGRVMAHSYVKELREIEKTSAVESWDPKEFANRGKGPSLASRFGAKAKEHAGKASDAIESRADKMIAGAKSLGQKGLDKAAPHAKKGLAFAKKHKGKGALGALAIGGGLAARKAMKKESSALDTLVEQRAQAILEASGIDPAALTEVQGQEKVSDPREALAAAVDERAWALLGQYGVVPNEQE